MKKKIMLTSTLVLAVIVLLSLKACIKDSGTRMYSFYTPVLHTTAEVRASVKSDVAQPIVNAGKIYVKGNFIFMIEKEKGIHIIDNSNPSSPINKAFITIPGNEDLAVNGNILYADCYTDLFAIDISNINNVTLKSYAANLYPERRYASGYYIDSNKIITDWIKHDTIVDASFSGNNYWYQGGIYFTSNPSMANASSAQSTTGTAGSMAKMAVINNRLYSVSSDNLLALNISDPSAPTFLSKNNLHLGIGTAETIYPFQDKLFIGSTSGMYIFSIADADNPTLLKTFTHATACDPVITDGINAFITLYNGSMCSGQKNELDVVNVTDVLNPHLVTIYPMSKPVGLAKDGNTLIICDDVLKVYDASNVSALQLKKSISINTPYDVICINGIAIVTAADGLYQFDYSNINHIQRLSKLSINQNN
ncbi:MAG TPA: hypothetical protein VHP12_07885 [Chitinophagaceae bacterium]|nr:hypothetical protein [Chitinophagaceae bacterium]